MKKDLLVSFMLYDISQYNKICDVLNKIVIKYNFKNLEMSVKHDIDGDKYLHARLHDVLDNDIKEIENYISEKLPGFNKVYRII